MLVQGQKNSLHQEPLRISPTAHQKKNKHNTHLIMGNYEWVATVSLIVCFLRASFMLQCQWVVKGLLNSKPLHHRSFIWNHNESGQACVLVQVVEQESWPECYASVRISIQMHQLRNLEKCGEENSGILREHSGTVFRYHHKILEVAKDFHHLL